jgi:hypothetical protein
LFMAEPIVIDLKLDGLDDALGGLQKLSQNATSLGTKGAKGIRALGQAAAYTKGPYTNLVKLQHELNDALRTGNQLYIANARAAYASGQAAVKRANTAVAGRSFGSKLGSAIASTRLGIGSDGSMSIMPLIGQLSTLLGPELAVPVMATVAAFEGLTAASKALQASFRDIQGSKNRLNATGSETTAARNLAGAAGFDRNDAGEIVDKLHDLRVSNPTVRRLLGPAAPGPLSPLDRGKEMIEDAQKFRKLSDKDARIAAREANMPDLMNWRNLPQKDFDQLVNAQGLDPKYLDSANRFRAREQALKGAQEADPFNIPLKFTQPYSPFAPGKEWAGPKERAAYGGSDGGGSTDKVGTKLDAINDTLVRQNRLIEGTARQAFGSGASAAKGAVPGMWQWEILDGALRSDSRKLGAFLP